MNFSGKKFFKIAFFFVFFIANKAFAYILLEPLMGQTAVAGNDEGFFRYVNSIINFALGLAVALAILKIAYGGTRIALGGDSDATVKDAKEDIMQAIYGLVLALASYLILYTINPDLVKLTF